MVDLIRAYRQEFFARPTLAVARELIGAYLCRRLPDGTVLAGSMVEVEAYTADDPACHAARGRTARTQVMFGPPGHAYVYFIYGMYFCLNVVTEPDGHAGAVLIRAVDRPGADGPGKLCRAFQIDKRFNGISLMNPDSGLWIAKMPPVAAARLGRSARVGISAATDRQWRFFLKGSASVSKGKPGLPSGAGSPRRALAAGRR